MKILFVGDIFGQPGKHAASRFIPQFVRERNIDFCVVNGENAAGGFGLTMNIADKLFAFGVNVITSGNHIFDRQEAYDFLPQSTAILRPANYPPSVPGRGYTIVKAKNGMKVGVLNLQGRIFMAPIDDPFRVADDIIDRLSEETRIILVDIHAEATSEKMALGWYLDGRVTAVIGTHTHVMTADERILPKGTAFITDVGMTGPHDSVIGVRIEQSLQKLMKQVPVRFSPAEKGIKFSAVIIEINDSTGKALAIERVFEDDVE
ncbi:MAG: TIGR00282 family metallophosphoesterase [Candidatus Latescibacter sp.]|nr:TIGR00282 family metallophosphoesterase [Candidatus Latescibacter sp.]